MIENKKALSAIIGTLLVLVIVLAAIVIIWAASKGTIELGVKNLEVSTKCIPISVKATNVDCTLGTCDVSIHRDAGGDEIAGVRIAINDGLNSFIYDRDGDMEELDTETITGLDPTTENVVIANIESVETAVYVKDLSGDNQICSERYRFTDIQI